jgi:hypothetical protein
LQASSVFIDVAKPLLKLKNVLLFIGCGRLFQLLHLISKAAQAQPVTAAPAASGALHNMAIRKGD